MKKATTLNKLGKYTAMSGAALLASSAVNADIVYTDIDPDAVSDLSVASVMDIDMDNDGSAEYYMYANQGSSYAWAPAGPQVYSASIAKASQGGYYAYFGAYSLSDKIDSNLSFFFPASQNDLGVMASIYNSTTYGNFTNEGEKYLGVKFDIAGDKHYGWIRVNLVNTDTMTLTVFDYAYNDVADEEILAGEGSPTFGTFEVKSLGANIYTSNGTLVVNFEEATTGELTIASLNGSVVFADKVNTTNYTTSLNNLTSGMYIVNVKTEKGMITKKITL